MTGKYEDLVELGEFYTISQKYDEAIKAFKNALKLNKHDPKLYFDLGVVYETINERDKAIEYFRKVITLDSKNKAAQEHLARLVEP